MGRQVSSETKVMDLIHQYPFMMDFLISYNSKFKLLKNRAMRATVGRMATLEAASKIAGVPAEQLVADVQAEIARHPDVEPAPLPEADADLPPDKVAGLKAIIQQLHDGADPADVKTQFDILVTDVAPAEIAAMEQQLIREGLPVSEVQRLCDVHARVFEGALDDQPLPDVPAGHPVHTYLTENERITELADTLGALSARLDEDPPPLTEITAALESLDGLESHYVRKENQLFPFLEKHDITGPSQVMWGVHDEIRGHYKTAQQAVAAAGVDSLREVLPVLSRAVGEMVFKENKILFPMALETLDESEWREIRVGEDELGYAYAEPGTDWPAGGEDTTPAGGAAATDGERLKVDTGALTLDQLNLLLKHLPLDITFVDEHDEVRYFSAGKERFFPRSPAIIGRKVQQCHPSKSVHMVQRILDGFRDGSHDEAEFWLELKGRFLHIRYFAVRDNDGAYRGCLEVTQDTTGIRALEGVHRLLDWDAAAQKK